MKMYTMRNSSPEKGRGLGSGRGAWALLALGILSLLWLLAGCGGQLAPKALDALRQGHWSMCIEHEPAPEDVEACDRMLAQLRQLEPAIEGELAGGRRARQIWTLIKPYAVQVLQALLLRLPIPIYIQPPDAQPPEASP